MESAQILSELDGQLSLVEHFIAAAEATTFLTTLLHEVPWRDEEIRMFGKNVSVPRRVCWYGDAAAVYKYSGIRHEPLPWIPALFDLKQRIEETTQQHFNSVLCNLYRDENDSMGWHADKEKELGVESYIASLSLGASRLFRVQHNASKHKMEVTLNHGSLLAMAGRFQKNWRHCVPKQTHPTLPRINLTFRYIHTQ